MNEEAAYLNCLCDHCSQKLEFPADAVGKEVDCPNCGQTTRLYWIQSKPPMPVPPPIRLASADALARKPTERTRDSIPPNPATPSNRPVTGDKGKSWVRKIVTVIVTSVVILGIGLPCIYVWQKRANEAEQVKQKTEQLKTELRLLEAQIQTGVSYNDFLAQVARVRAAHLAAAEVLTHDQELAYSKVDSCFDKCADIWNPKSLYHIGNSIELEQKVYPVDEAKFGVKFDMGAGGEYGFDTYHAVVPKLLKDIGEDIEAFLKDQPCPWPK